MSVARKEASDVVCDKGAFVWPQHQFIHPDEIHTQIDAIVAGPMPARPSKAGLDAMSSSPQAGDGQHGIRTPAPCTRCRQSLLLLLLLGTAASWHGAAAAAADEQCVLDQDVLAQMKRELEPWRQEGVSMEHMRGASRLCQPGDEAHSCNAYLRMTIQDGMLYLNSLADRSPNHQPHWELPGQILEIYETALLYKLPNVDFTIFLGDEAHDVAQQHRLRLPMFAPWKGSSHTACITVPNSGSYRCSRDGIDLLTKRLPDVDKTPWEKRAPVAYARHGPACPHWTKEQRFPDHSAIPCPRQHLDTLSKTHPDLLDSSSREGDARGTPLMDHTKYRYLVSTDGVSCSNKLDRLLLMGSTVIKQESRRYGWYYSALKPHKHYVPIFVNKSDDILEAVQWLRDNDAKAQAISKAGRQLALSLLTRPSRLCFWKTLIEHYAKLLRYKPSCKLHRMCVPAIYELNYLGHYDKLLPAHVEICEIHRQLDDIHGKTMDHGQPKSDSYGGPNSTFGFPDWFLREDNGTLEAADMVKSWQPPW